MLHLEKIKYIDMQNEKNSILKKLCNYKKILESRYSHIGRYRGKTFVFVITIHH